MTEATASSRTYRNMMGKPGVVYILENDGLRQGWLKIGCSTRSAAARARDLNLDASTGTPGLYRPVYEVRTLDCGAAEAEVFRRLKNHRRGKWGQEFFEVELSVAKQTIHEVCTRINRRHQRAPNPGLYPAQAMQEPSPRPERTQPSAPPVAISALPVVGKGRWADFERRLRIVALVSTTAALATTLQWRNLTTPDRPAQHPVAKRATTERHTVSRTTAPKASSPAPSSVSRSVSTKAPAIQPSEDQRPGHGAGASPAMNPKTRPDQDEDGSKVRPDENEKVPYPY